MVIDSHIHFFQSGVIEGRDNYLSDPGFSILYSNPAAKTASADEASGYLNDSGISRAFVMGFPWADLNVCMEQNEFFAAMADKDSRLIPFGAVPSSSDSDVVRKAVRAAKDLGLSGVGEAAWYSAGMDETALKCLETLIESAGEDDLPLCLHVNEPVGHSYPGKYYPALNEMIRIIGKYPGVRIMLSHWGGGLVFYELMPEVKEALQSCVYDTAATPYIYSENIYTLAAETAGSDRVLFGSDFPLLRAGRYVQGIEQCGKETAAMIFGKNAAAFMDIETV